MAEAVQPLAARAFNLDQAPTSERWRVGRKVGRTIYIGDRLVGLMDNENLARQVVEAVNGTPRIENGDLRVEPYFAIGQLVNEGPRGVTITHVPTGLVASCYENRSQLMNKVQCMRELHAAIAAGVPGDA
jgi:hypothetical protein